MIIGCIHGRFQPFHNGHLEYLAAAIARCDRLIIGITQYEPELYDAGSPQHRMELSENPFSFWERVQIIRRAVDSAGLPLAKIAIVPFPIHDPRKIRYFVDAKAVMFTTIFDKWNVEKIRRLRNEGFRVCVLWRRRWKEIEGKQVREALERDLQRFRALVPSGTYDMVLELRRR